MRPRNFRSPLPRFALYAVLAGAILAAAALPASILVGDVVKVSSDTFNSLPANLRIPPDAQTTYVYANDGKTLLTTFYDENRRDVPLDQIAPVMRQAIVSAEDSRFYQHGGVDLKGVVRALVTNARDGGVAQGASTLTMQYVRNVLKNDPNLSQEQRAGATADTLGRKIQEMRYAVALDGRLSKDEILNRYLNIAYFGAGAYGIYAASRTYFATTPDQLTLPQAALLAGLVQSPDRYNPISGDRKAALDRRTYVLNAMVKSKNITSAQAAGAKATALALHPVSQPNNCVAAGAASDGSGFFCGYLRQWWDGQSAFGATVAEREHALTQGGYSIVTSLDPTIQKEALAQSLHVYGYDNPRALPIAVVQPGTGHVLAMAVNRHYSLDANPAGRSYPNTVNPLISGGGSISGYQSGSTFKMFTMLAALEAGKTLDTRFNAPAALPTRWPDSGPTSCDGKWCPVNENPAWMDGNRTMWTGFGRSVNTYFVWLEEQVGVDKAVAMAQKLGITFRARQDAELAANPDGWGAFTLGVADTTPLDLANAYATLGANGTYCTPLPVLSIKDAAGQAVSAGQPQCHQAVAPDIAHAATDAARCPVGQESAFGRCDGGTATMVADILGGRPVAGKTGSSENNATETFVGYTPQIAAAGIAANPDTPNDYVGAGISAAVDEAVARTIQAGVAGQPYQDFPAPPASLAFGAGGPGAGDPGTEAGTAGGNPGNPAAPGRRARRGGRGSAGR